MKIKLFYLTLLIVGLCACNNPNKSPDSVIITFTGDLLLDRGVREIIEIRGMDKMFSDSVRSMFAHSDYVISNLECPVTSIRNPINKKYSFRAEPEWLDDLFEAGITHLNLANNHSMDQGREGLLDTRKNISNSGMIPTGYGNNEGDACSAICLSQYPRKIVLFSSVLVKSENWTYLPDQPCVCEASVSSIIPAVKEYRNKNSKAVIIVQLHWGREHSEIPELFQVQQARELITAGADCIIGHHTHTIQNFELYKGKAIFYSLGNFIFDQKRKLNAFGLVAQLEIQKDTILFQSYQVNSYP